MNRIRAFVHAPSGLHRLLPTFATALVLVAGLLAMHTLPAAHAGGHGDTSAALAEPAHITAFDGDAWTPVASTPVTAGGMNSAASADHCAGACDDPGGAPDHSLLMTTCVLALLAAAILLLAPVMQARLAARTALLRLPGSSVSAPRAHLRPPSLIALSISRT